MIRQGHHLYIPVRSNIQKARSGLEKPCIVPRETDRIHLDAGELCVLRQEVPSY